MIKFEEFSLDNGLKVIVHPDPTTSIVCLNTLYQVGSRNEYPDKTGFAHLFEHLMFGGSQHIENFDQPLQLVGGENNAFTNTDITNYYTTVPSNNVETAFWLESDRMLGLSFNPEVLEVQRSVVIEEYKQRYLNQPYGDVWHLIRENAYLKHPYRWPTIGKSIAHIQEATMEDVKAFFKRHYHPSNAILVIAGDITLEKARKLTEKWYGKISKGSIEKDAIVQESPQKELRKIEVIRRVPNDMIYKCYHMSGRSDRRYFATDLLSDMIGRGKSSRLYQSLVMESSLFSNVNAYVTGSLDPGLLVINGQLNPNTTLDQANEAIENVLSRFDQSDIKEELDKVKNLATSSIVFGEAELLNRAMNLAMAKVIGETEEINEEQDKINAVNTVDIHSVFEEVIQSSNETLLYYQSNKE
jgi:zinc protease